MPWKKQMADLPLVGIFRRQIDLKSWDDSMVVGWLEDESHHFGITLVHDGEYVREIRVAAPRHPWSTCANAGRSLQELVGQPLISRCADIGLLLKMSHQCTHLFDLAGLVLAHAHARRTHRRYRSTVQPLADVVAGAPAGWQRATLYRNDREVLRWDLSEETIMAPAPFTGRSILHGFREWCETRDAVEAEDALVLRRVAFVSNGRRIDIEHLRFAADLEQGPVCYTFQPENRDNARPVPGNKRSFDGTEGAMLGFADTSP